MTLEDAVSVLKAVVERDEKTLPKTLRIDLTGLGSLIVEGRSVIVGQSPAASVLEISPDDFGKIVSGELVTFNALMTGRLKVSGDLMLAREFRRMILTAQEEHGL